MAPEEVDLTGATPPKKMKQAKLPFGSRPLNKQLTAPENVEGTRKRKLSASEEKEENLTPSKALKREDVSKEEVPSYVSTIKSKLAIFAHKDESEGNKGGKDGERNLLPKKDKKKPSTSPDDEVKVENPDLEKKEKEGKFQGLLKMPFKKTKKKEKKEGDDTEDDFDLVLESSVEESVMTEESSMTSFSSMTDEWAKYHENRDTDQSMEDLEAGSETVLTKKTKVEKQKEKEEKLKKKQEEKALKEEERARAKAEKEKQKQLQKEEKERLKEEKTKVKQSDEAEVKPAPKVNPLAKFLIRGKDAEKKSSDNKKKESSEGTGAKSVDDENCSAPVTSVLAKSMPGRPVTPNTPDPGRAQKLNIAKMKVMVTELNIAMEKAVEDKDFLKAHETKEKVKQLEEKIKKMEMDPSHTSEALIKTAPILTAAETPKTPCNVSLVSTPGSAKSTAGKGTKREALEKERKEKREALELEKQAKKEALELEKQAKKEALELEKQAKKEAKEKERLEKEKQRELEKQAKAEEKLEKDRLKKVEKEKAEAEKLRLKQEKEEEKLRKKEEKEQEKKQQEIAEKEKARKEANVFLSFFKKEDPAEKKENESARPTEENSTRNLTVFRVKPNMRLAPLVRGDPERAKRNIDSLDMPSDPDGLYLSLLNTGYTVGRQGRTWPYERLNEKDEVEILEDEEEESDPEDELNETNTNIIMRKGDKSVKIRAKLLKFHENQRPAYWGTWTKSSKFISGRRPFGRDEERFDYDYDSDDDWEEEEEGESLSDDEKDKEDDEENEDYEVDNEFFVPHGYLSDEEEDKEEDEVLDPETAKEKQKLAAKAFEKEHKKKTQELKPRLWGTFFPDGEVLQDAATMQMAKILSGYTAIVLSNNNLVDTSYTKKAATPTVSRDDLSASVKTSTAVKGAKAKQFPEEAVPDLIRLVHGNNNNKMFLAKEFLAFWDRKTGDEPVVAMADGPNTPSGKGGMVSRKKVVDKIQEIAEYRRGKGWMVKAEVLAKFGVSSPKSWDYILEQPNKNTNNEEVSVRPESPAGPALAPANLITKFARVLTEEEKEEARARQERDAVAARQKKEEQAAKLAAMKAELAVKQVTESPSQTAGDKNNFPLQRFTKTLSEMEKKAQQTSEAPAKKRVALTPVMPNIKNNPIVAIAGGPQAAGPNKGPMKPSPIAVKRKPGNAVVKASPIAVKRAPGPPASGTALSFKGLLPESVTVTPVKTSGQDPVECITIDE